MSCHGNWKNEQEIQWKLIEEQRIIAENTGWHWGTSWVFMAIGFGGACISRELALEWSEIGRQARETFPIQALCIGNLELCSKHLPIINDCLADQWWNKAELSLDDLWSWISAILSMARWCFWKLGRYRESLAELDQYSRQTRYSSPVVRVYLSIGWHKTAVPFIRRRLNWTRNQNIKLQSMAWEPSEAAIYKDQNKQLCGFGNFAPDLLSLVAEMRLHAFGNNALSMNPLKRQGKTKSLNTRLSKGIVA